MSNIDRMTLEEVKAKMVTHSHADLLTFFNKFSGSPKPAKKVKREVVTALVDRLIEKKAEGKAKAGKGKGKHQWTSTKISKVGAGLVKLIREMMEGYDTDEMTMEDVLIETGSVASTVEPILEKLIKGGWLVQDSQGNIQLTTQGKEASLRTDGKMTGAPGPSSKFTNHSIIPLVKENPRREGTHGHTSFALIPSVGITYEEYKARGGRNNDLAWDIAHKYVEMKVTKK